MVESKFLSLRATLGHFLGGIRAGFGLIAAPPQRINPDFQRFIARLEEVLELDAVTENSHQNSLSLSLEPRVADLFFPPLPIAMVEPTPLEDKTPAVEPAPVAISLPQPTASFEPGAQSPPQPPRKRRPGTRRKPAASAIPDSKLDSPPSPKRRAVKKPPSAPSIPNQTLNVIHPSQLPPSKPDSASEAPCSPKRAPKSHPGRTPAKRQPSGRQATLTTDGP
jgi:hypothetical protein